MHKRRGKINSTVRRVKRVCLSDMVCLFGRWLCVTPLVNRDKRKRLFCSERTFWLFLSQVLQGNISCKETVQKALAWLCLKEGKTASPNSAGYCGKSERLPTAYHSETRMWVPCDAAGRDLFSRYRSAS